MKKILRFIKKVSQGHDVTKVRHSEAEWDRQFTAGKWDFLLRTPYNVAATAVMVERLAADRTEPLRILDIGCGNGALGREIAALPISYTGTDISQVALDQAAVQYPAGTYICTSMDSTPDLVEQYDLIIFSEVLLYGDYERILGLHKPLLAPDGKVIVSLYDTWRTKWIWWRIRTQLSVLESVTVRDETRNTRWRIKLADLT